MRAATLIAAFAALAGLAAGCGVSARPDAPYRLLRKAQTAVAPPPGILYTHYKAPLSVAPGGIGPKKGSATAHQIGLPPLPFPGMATGLDLFAWGDASVKAAAESGGIAQVNQAEYDLTEVLMIYRRFTTEVYGD